ncbi:MAG: Caspase domain [Bacteroidetes bacterium HLUCCA01]|nr:MAG: Caspase domain [Bacteroidetes bacterium HLUCCA01]
MKLKNIFVLIAALLMTGCTSSRWIIEDEPAADTSQSVLISSDSALLISGEPTPENPVLQLNGRQIDLYEAPMRLEANRVIQQYRPRLSWVMAGMLGAGSLFYIANSGDFFAEELTASQKNLLMATGGLVLGASLLNMKPRGEPRYTGESRFLNQVGTDLRADSTDKPAPPFDVIINGSHENETLINGLQLTVNGEYTLNLISELGLRSFSPDEPGVITLEFITEFDSITVEFPLQRVLKRYVRVARRNTPLRNSQQTGTNNIVTTVAEASLLPWVETTDTGWHRVLMGITPVFVSSTDGAVVWRPAVSNESNLVVTTANMSFGSVDVERDIPRKSQQGNERSIAILIGNQNYRNDTLKNEYAHRSLRLMRTYLQQTLGYREENIITIEDFTVSDEADNLIRFNAQDNTLFDRSLPEGARIFVYFSGKGGVVNQQGRSLAGLLAVDGLPGEGVALEQLMSQLARIPRDNPVNVVIDADFREISPTGLPNRFEPDYQRMTRVLTERNDRSWILFASGPTQYAGHYVSNDRRTDRVHGILTYYFARALQDGNTDTESILRYLQRNMTFTSRRLHNRAQDPVFIGNSRVNLIDITEN